jgi:hypothetical protein
MQRASIDSTSLASAGYDPKTRTLEVEFRGGRVYRYLHVPPRVYRALLEAESAGRFLNKEIKGTYPYAAVEDRNDLDQAAWRRPPRRQTA